MVMLLMTMMVVVVVVVGWTDDSHHGPSRAIKNGKKSLQRRIGGAFVTHHMDIESRFGVADQSCHLQTRASP
jgi:hypothetical protein